MLLVVLLAMRGLACFLAMMGLELEGVLLAMGLNHDLALPLEHQNLNQKRRNLHLLLGPIGVIL